MALGRVFLSSSKVLIFLSSYYLLSSENSSIQYYYDYTSFYSAISTVAEKDSSNYVFDCPWSCGRHFVCSPRAKGFFSSRLQHYANSTSCFQQVRLFISGDISLNPYQVSVREVERYFRSTLPNSTWRTVVFQRP